MANNGQPPVGPPEVTMQQMQEVVNRQENLLTVAKNDIEIARQMLETQALRMDQAEAIAQNHVNVVDRQLDNARRALARIPKYDGRGPF